MDKPVFITGATGSIGGVLARRFANQGTRLRLLVRDRKKAVALQTLPCVELVDGDIGQPLSIQGVLEGCGVVFHCAAKLQGSHLDEYVRVNVQGTEALVKEAIRARIDRFVHISSFAVYGYPNAQAITEEHEWVEHGDTPYVSTKQEAEKAVRHMCEGGGLKFSIARPGDVYGPGQFTWTIQFVQLLRRGVLHPPTASSSGMINLVYIDNLVDALLLLGEHPKALGQAFNIVDQPISMHDYIVMLANMARVPALAVPGGFLYAVAGLLQFFGEQGGREARITRDGVSFLLYKSTISSYKLRSLLGWAPRVSVEEAMRLTEVWLRANGYIQ